MIKQTFTLIPFSARQVPSVSLTANLLFHHNILTLHYVLVGNVEEVLLPAVSHIPSRKDDLWKETCFEFFLAIKDQPGYWEFNMSPSGDWNVYWMDDYRRIGFREEPGISQLPLEFKKGPDEYSLNVSVDLTPFIEPGHELEMAVTAVIQTQDGSETYWALAHPAPYADFHLRESFILTLAEQTLPSEKSVLGG